MKLATVYNGLRDGKLVVVSTDASRYLNASDIAPNLQAAVEQWDRCEPMLRALADALKAGDGQTTKSLDWMAPLPRAWQWLDGSVFRSHGDLMKKALKVDPADLGKPLMYQGMSHQFLAGDQDVPFVSEADGIDFEGEFGIITDQVPMGISASEAVQHIKLIVQINDWSLRALAGPEMKTGFGWIHAKPACSMAPFAVTPDELGEAWQNFQVALEYRTDWNGKNFGHPLGNAMEFGFDQLVEHAAYSRSLCAGTVIGSGTVSNENYREVGSSCIAERRGIEIIDRGEPSTGFMKFGDRVRMRALDANDQPVFGEINQRVVANET
jgi:fumarylacetoacetate (FAA) hydrolase